MLSSLALLLCAHAAVSSENHSRPHHNTIRKSGKAESSDCLYEGLWYAAGASVRTREVCLACVCAQGALSCRRRSCAPQPEPPSRCHIVHRRGDCCPELQCPDGVRYLDQTASGRFDDSNIEMPSSIGHACVEGGTVYAAGSAMSSNIACEQCFCLGGSRRCVRPRCLPPPPGCTARPTSGACCPQRYYCEHSNSKPPSEKKSHDCVTPKGNWVNEGGRVKESEIGSKCIQCFCLHGSIRCQYLSCAPTLHGCKPLVQPGQCCAHQYTCDHHINDTKSHNLSHQRQNTLLSLKEETRSFHTSKSTKRETTTKDRLTAVTDKTMPAITVTKVEPIQTTMKVKRKTDDIQVVLDKADATRMMTIQTTNDFTTTIIETTTEMLIEKSTQELTTEQPEGSVRIIINGTINCTSELSSSSLLLNVTDVNDTMWNKHEIQQQQQQRTPLIDKYDNVENTFFSNDIITEGSYNANFDEDETFNVNVTTSLNANNTRTVTSTTIPKIILFNSLNTSKVKKEEFEYDYTEPTLPPSLPNLKIIPFVAADAVVDDEISSKEMPNYPVLEKEDKFPIYYPKDPKETIFSMRKEHIYNNTHYSLYTPEIESKDESQYPGTIEDESTVNIGYPSITNDVPDVHEYTVTASFGNPAKFNSIVKSESNSASKFEMENPVVNLFSPPAETEGGFVPKDPELMEDFYSVHQSTSSGPIPHLTTSMQLETKDICISSDGRRIREGETISFACSLCSCAWGELHCSPQPCLTPPGCKRLTASKNTADPCCGELICDYNNKTTKNPLVSQSDVKINLNETKVSFSIEDKEMVNVMRQDNKSYGSDLTYNNQSLQENITPGNFSLMDNATSHDTVNDSPPRFTVTEATVKTPTTERSKVISNHSLEYEDDDDDEEDDEGFSLGSVLKLLLSETYESTTIAPTKQKTTAIPHTSKAVITTLAPTTTTKIRKPSTVSEKFNPVTHRYPYILHKHPNHQFNTVDRIDHLVLGEASAIRKTSTQPAVTFKPVTFTTTRRTTTAKTTQRPISTNSVEITSKEGFINQLVEIRPPSNFLSGFGLGLPKLAGCNIYGRMYRVGRIIAELSSPCQECKCTELGVQCRSLGC